MGKVFDAIVIGAGVSGICQLKFLLENNFDAIALEANEGLGGTWFCNRYPGCRFDSESYTYGYAFSREVLDEWHWSEHFSPQPETLKYLNFVAEKFDLPRHIRFNAHVAAMRWDEENCLWHITLNKGEELTARFVITCLGVLSVPFVPPLEGLERFQGEWFHSYNWPHREIDLTSLRVGVVGTGATGIQIIGEIADKTRELYVFQREPNWAVPLNNAPISKSEMAAIQARYEQIFQNCALSQGGFEHLPDRRGYENTSPEERRALWDELYDAKGFALLLANFPETFLEKEANQDLSRYVADRIRARVTDPAIAEQLIPKTHGFGMKRLPMETNYYESYNRDNVHLVNVTQTPIKRVAPTGIETTKQLYELDLIVYATGFHSITGGLNRIDIYGTNKRLLRDKWRDETRTYLGLMTSGFPNMLMVAGPQSVSGSTNFPRAIEVGVDWITNLLLHARKNNLSRIEPQADAEQTWLDEVAFMQDRMPFSKVKSWFTGYNPSKPDADTRYNAYWGGAPRYRRRLRTAAKKGYPLLDLK